jgi:mRNA-degrading endonuclease RelE of RelBE toxin-antitoxin system
VTGPVFLSGSTSANRRWDPEQEPPLLPPVDGRFSARRGTYTVIYRIDDKARVVTVVDVAHRRDAYRT